MKKVALLSLIASGALCLPAAVNAQTNSEGFTKLPSGLEFKIAKHGTGTVHPSVGDHLEMHIHVHIKDSSMFDSRRMNGNKPVPFQVQPPNFKGDPIEGFMLMSAGDSAVMHLPVDSLMKQNKQMMPGMKAGDVLEYEVVLISVTTDADYKRDMALKSAQQQIADDATLKEYFKTNKITPKKTASGLYYTISTPGTGVNAKAGQFVSVNYTGKFMDGKTFDSNTDPEFKHVEPFTLKLGTGGVIKGWDEGLALLKKGSKAKLYIPSALAYGGMERNGIPANSILIFDVEIKNISDKDPKPAAGPQAQAANANQPTMDEKLIKDYLAKNKIKAKKTASGLYYIITQEGTGDKPAANQKVSVMYTGTTLDGKKFDSNIDPAFNHPTPLEFPIGAHAVIAGWDEGIAMLNKGSKATLFIPSGLAYGPGSPTPAIPPNSVLVFDVELKDIIK